MTAKELHGLYSPLWGLAPETRPMREGGRYALKQHPGFESNFAWVHECNDACCQANTKPQTVFFQEAAALCRVAVEDWLLLQCMFSITRIAGDSRDAVWVSSPGGSSIDDCPTIHHALVSAALAVAKAKGKP